MLTALLVSCGPKIGEDDIVHLNGYWEIEYVKLPDGSRKDYKINETIDHVTMKGMTGVRQKMMPQFDGTYLTNGQTEKLTVDLSGDAPLIRYNTPYAKWSEEIIELSDQELVVKNDKLEYHYKRPVPFTVK